MASKTEAKIKFEADAAPFTQAISQASRTLTELRSALKLNAAQLAANGNNVEDLSRKQELLAQKAQALADKKAALTEKLRLAEEQLGANSSMATNLRASLNYLEIESTKLQTEMDGVTSALARQQGGSADHRTALERLSDTISDQEQKLDRLKQAYSSAVLEYGKNSREAKDLAGELSSLSSELEDNRAALNDAQTAAGRAAGEMDDLGSSMADAEDDALSLSDVITGNLIADGLQALGDALTDAAESTREYRTIMASLEVSSERAGYSASETAQTYRTLYGVLNDDQSAATTTANLQAMGLAQSDLQQVLLGTIGAWATYGDSIPIDSLAEAINETVQTGAVTGTFADVLNWAGASEEDFNAKLQEANSSTERAQIVLTELARQGLTEAGKAWQENNTSLVEANQATADQQAALARLGAAAEPVLTAVTNGFTGVLEAVADVAESLNTAGIADKLEAGFGFVLDNGAAIIAVISGIAAAFLSFQAITGIAAAIGTVTTAISGFVTALGMASSAWALLQAAFIANPFGVIATAIGVAIAAGVALYQNWDTICQWAGKIAQTIADAWNGIVETVSGAAGRVWTAVSDAWSSIQSKTGEIFSAVQEAVSSGWTAVRTTTSNLLGNIRTTVSNGWNNVRTATSNAFSQVRSATSSAWNNVRSLISSAASNARNSVSSTWNSLRSTTSSVFSSVRSTASSAWNSVKSSISSGASGALSTVKSKFNSIKSSISNVMNSAKNAVSSAINSIKSKFNFKWSLPKLKLPHVSIKGSFSLSPPSVPRFSVSWYREGGILEAPTIFGRMGSTLLGGGEAGPEAVAPIDVLQDYVASAVERTISTSISSLAAAVQAMADRPVYLQINGRTFAAVTAGDTDDALGTRQALMARGLCL